MTHAASGIGEAFLDGIPMLVIAGGIRRDLGRAYQLHDMDQHALLAPITKARWRVERHADVIPVIHEAYRVATIRRAGPGVRRDPGQPAADAGRRRATRPAFAPAPAAGQPRRRGATSRAPRSCCAPRSSPRSSAAGARWMRRRSSSRSPSCSARRSRRRCRACPRFPGNHRLHAGFALGRAAVPAVENAFDGCDALLAVGTRFAEIPTGSYGWEPPANLVHVDINPRVFGANYPRRGRARGRRARGARGRCATRSAPSPSPRAANAVAAAIAKDKRAYREEWLAHDSKGRVNPQRFFDALRARLPGRRNRGRGRRQPHFPGRRADADPRAARLLLAVRLQLHGLLHSRRHRREARAAGAHGGRHRRRRRGAHDRPRDGDRGRAEGRRRLVRVQRRRARADRAGAGDALQPQDLHGAARARLRGRSPARTASASA